MSQELEITFVYVSKDVQFYEGDIVSDLIPIRMGTADIRLHLDNRSEEKVEFTGLYWPDGQPDFIKDATVSKLLIVIHDTNETVDQQGNFRFKPELLIERRPAHGPDPTIINTDIPGGVQAQLRRVRSAKVA